MLAPVVIFVYARPIHTKKTIESLAKNYLADETELYIYSDGAKNEKVMRQVDLVRKYIDSLPKRNLFKSVKINKAETNRGLANSVIDGVTEIISLYGKAIVVEDDLVLSPDFLKYTNEALDFYEGDEKIWSICGYTFKINIPKDYKHDVYLSYRGCSWGWATWQDRWEKVDWDVTDYDNFKNNKELRKKINRGGRDMADMLDRQMNGKLDSWAIRWCFAQSKLDMFTVYPVISKIKNIGLDGTGTHSGISSKYDVILSNNPSECKFENIIIDKRITKNFKNQFGNNYQCFIIRLKKIIKKYLK